MEINCEFSVIWLIRLVFSNAVSTWNEFSKFKIRNNILTVKQHFENPKTNYKEKIGKCATFFKINFKAK